MANVHLVCILVGVQQSSFLLLAPFSIHPFSFPFLTCWNPYNDSWGHVSNNTNSISYNFISFISIHTMIYVGYTAYEKSAIEITMKPGWYITLWHFNIQPYDHHQHLSLSLSRYQNRSSLLHPKFTCWRPSISIEFNANVCETLTHKHIQMRAEHSFCVYKRLN